jgi:nicotinate-nucleotide adenylyltransferase
MLKIAIGEHKYMDIDDLEIKRDSVSYAIDTIILYKEKWPDAELIYLIGNDNLRDFNKWKEYKNLPELARFMVLRRTAEETPADDNKNFVFLHNPLIEISSTMLRDRIRSGRSCRFMIPDKVLKYIHDNHLYSLK